MLGVMTDILLLVLRTFVAVNLNRLKIKRITLLRYNRTVATQQEIATAKAIDVKIDKKFFKFGTPSQDTVMKVSESVDVDRVDDKVNTLEAELIAEKEEHLKDIAAARGIAFLSNSDPYVKSKSDSFDVMGFAKEEGENFVIGSLANAALVSTAAATGGASAVIGVGVDMGIEAVRMEVGKMAEEEQERKDEYAEKHAGDVLMLSSSAKKRIRMEAEARVNAEEQEQAGINKSSEMVAGSPEWNAAKNRLEVSIKSMKFLLKILDTLFAILTAILLIMGAVMLLTALVVVVVVSFVASPVSDEESAGGSNPGAAAPPPKEEGGEGEPAPGPEAGGTAVPEGIDPESWNKASEWGKKIATASIAYSIMTIKTPATAANNDHLVYMQGNTPVGVYDCSVFVTAVHESFGYMLNGEPRDGVYDFNTQQKSDLRNYLVTGGMMGLFSSRPEMMVGTYGVGDWESKIQPGDVLVNSGHVVMYIGKNTAGTHIIAHAGAPGAQTYYDTALTIPGSDVGLGAMWDFGAPIMIGRPTVAFK